MIITRKSNDRGHTKIDWLDSFHTFSFGEYQDTAHMGFSKLRVINQDIVQPGKGFGSHPHQRMEIISYVIDGELEHEDSLGTGSIIRPGEIQRMSAGTGVIHSEYNHSEVNPVHFLQIWILPDRHDIPASYEQKKITKKFGEMILLGSNEKSADTILIHQDVKLYVAYLKKNDSITYLPSKSRRYWLQMIKGKIHVNQTELLAGDGAAIENEISLEFFCDEEAEFLFFDLP